MPRLFGKGCLNELDIAEEEELRDHCCAAAIVRAPCCCCWLSLLISIAATIFGWLLMIQANSESPTGPLRVGDEGLNYPYTHLIARQMDALRLATKSSELSWIGRSAGRRRLLDETLPVNGTTLLLTEDGTAVARAMLTSMLSTRASLKADNASATMINPAAIARARNRRLNSQWQTSQLTLAIFVFRARSRSGSAFSDAGLDELCAMHSALTTDVTPSGPYTGFEDFCQMRDDGGGLSTCFSGFTPLVFFYGDDASYAIDGLDIDTFLATISGPHFNTIAAAIATGGDTSAVQALYPTEFAQVSELIATVFDFMDHWLDAPIQRTPTTSCDPSTKKDVSKVLRVVAAIRANVVLNALFGGVINFYFDSAFGENNLKSVFTRSTYNYGAPLRHGTPPFNDASDRRATQEDAFVHWFWRDARLQRFYDETDRAMWAALEPTGLIPVLLQQMLVDLLIQDGSRAVVPLLVVFLVVWFQTRSMFIALVTIIECILSFTAAVLPVVALGIEWMAFEQFLAIYIVLAIGADDVRGQPPAHSQPLAPTTSDACPLSLPRPRSSSSWTSTSSPSTRALWSTPP